MLSQRGIEGSNPFSLRLTGHCEDYVTIIPKQAFCCIDGQVILSVSKADPQGQQGEIIIIFFFPVMTKEVWTAGVLSYCMYTFEVWGDVIPSI